MSDRHNSRLAALAASTFLLLWLPSVIGRSGYFIDEFYYLVCARRLALGYVDHPPLSVFVLRLVTATLGDSLAALRLVPSVIGAATVFLAGITARRLGANGFGQLLAAAAVIVVTPYQVMFSFFSMNALELLIWALSFLTLIEIERRDEPRLWLVFGVLLGIGFENKHTVLLLAGSLGSAILLTPARRHLAGGWFWAGLGVALALAAPNLLWQAVEGWPSLEFYRAQDIHKNVTTPPLEALKLQFLGTNPSTFPIWVSGLLFFLLSARGRRYRHLGWIYLVLLALLLIGEKSRPDRIAPAYLVLFAGGGLVLGEWAQRARWRRVVLPALLVGFGLAMLPVGLPVLPPRATADYSAFLGVVPQIEKGPGKRSRLPQWIADRYGWEELVDDVDAVYRSLPDEERRQAIIFGAGYGVAAPLEILGGPRGLPRTYSGHNNYFLWGPPPDPVEIAIVVGLREAGVEDIVPSPELRRLFDDIRLARVHHCAWCMSWRDDMPIWVVRKPRASARDEWPRLKFFL